MGENTQPFIIPAFTQGFFSALDSSWLFFFLTNWGRNKRRKSAPSTRMILQRPLKCFFRLSRWHPETRLLRFPTLFSSIMIKPRRVPLSLLAILTQKREKMFSWAAVADPCHIRCEEFWSKYFSPAASRCHCARRCETGLQLTLIILSWLWVPMSQKRLVVSWEFTCW